MANMTNSIGLRLILHAIFLLSGTLTVLVGQLLPILTRQHSLNDLQAGFYFPAQFAGSLFGTFLTGRLARNNQFILASILGGMLMAIGVVLLNIDSFAISLVGFLITGIGIGLTLPAINMTVLEMNPINTASALSILNFCWGVGAIICKPFVDLTSNDSDIRLTTIVLATLVTSVTGLLFLYPLRSANSDKAGAIESEIAQTPIWTTSLAWTIALFNFVHVGFESGMGGWLTTYTDRFGTTATFRWLSPTLAYFVFFVVGRGIAPILFRYFSENRMLLLGLFTILAGMTITVTTTDVLFLTIGATISGFGTSWIFPTNISRFSRTFGPSATRRAMPLFICGTLGAAASTWLIGFVSNATGNLRLGMYVLIVSVLMLIVLQFYLAGKTTDQRVSDLR